MSPLRRPIGSALNERRSRIPAAQRVVEQAGTRAVRPDPPAGPPTLIAGVVQLNGSAPASQARRQVDGAAAPILPDCCSPGIAFRIAVIVNLVALAGAMLIGADFRAASVQFIDSAYLIEPALALSLLALCLLRRRVNGLPRHWQWSVSVGVPALITALIAALLSDHHHLAAAPLAGSYRIAVRALVAGGATVLLVEYFRLRARAFSPSLSEARLQALQARIRPHFLFNSLNTVLGLMRSSPRQAESTLENLADLFRVFMRDTRELVALEDEVTICRQYLEIEQLRLGDRLTVNWQVDEATGDALVPSLLLQPLLENAVHHGIEPSIEPGEIAISVKRRGERIYVDVVNPLAEAAASRPGNQMALSNVRERLALLYDMEAELKSGPENGKYRLRLEFPYRKERRRRDVRRTVANSDR